MGAHGHVDGANHSREVGAFDGAPKEALAVHIKEASTTLWEPKRVAKGAPAKGCKDARMYR